MNDDDGCRMKTIISSRTYDNYYKNENQGPVI